MDYNFDSKSLSPEVLLTLSLSYFFWFIVFIFLYIVPMWKMFSKAGQPGWAVLVPVYNLYIMLKISGKPGWWMLLFFVPVVNFVVAIIIYMELAKAFGRSSAFGFFMLFLLPLIGFPILGYGHSSYIGPGGNAQGSNTPSQINPLVQPPFASAQGEPISASTQGQPVSTDAQSSQAPVNTQINPAPAPITTEAPQPVAQPAVEQPIAQVPSQPPVQQAEQPVQTPTQTPPVQQS